MRHLLALQRKDGRWDFVCMRKDTVRPVGYCREYDAIDVMNYPLSDEEQHHMRSFAHKYHTDGHDTAEEAQECYKRYLLDQRLRLGQRMSNQQQKCRICDAWTDQFVTIGASTLYVLCSQHNNRESVAELYKAPTEIWES